MAVDKKTFVTIYAGVWLAIALVTLGWLVVQNVQFNQCCRGTTSDMALGIITIFYGLPAVIVAINAFTLLFAKNNTVRLLVLVLLGLVTTLFFMSVPVLSIACLTAAGFALYCAHTMGPGSAIRGKSKKDNVKR